jgi:phage FluMu protein Com
MARTCKSCGAAVKIRSFQYWDGCCPNCRAPMAAIARVEEALRQPPTSEEVGAFLKHMDELYRMRFLRRTLYMLMPALATFHILGGVGVQMKLIEPGYGFFLWISMFVAAILPFIGYFRFRCPRCRGCFSQRKDGRPHFRADTCANCGLRALTQYDLMDFWKSETKASMAPASDR